MFACMHVRRRGQEFEKKQGQGSRGELEEGKGMEGNDPGEERASLMLERDKHPYCLPRPLAI